jgi:hypothetical protein
MRQDLEEKLFQKYPKIFSQKDLPMTQTLMCFGFECGDGWYNIIDALCRNIQNHIDHKIINNKFNQKQNLPEEEIIQIEATQVKEKYGSLCFYVNYSDEYVDGLIDMASTISSMTCEICGNPGKQNKNGWIITLCNVCREQKEKKDKI